MVVDREVVDRGVVAVDVWERGRLRIIDGVAHPDVASDVGCGSTAVGGEVQLEWHSHLVTDTSAESIRCAEGGTGIRGKAVVDRDAASTRTTDSANAWIANVGAVGQKFNWCWVVG